MSSDFGSLLALDSFTSEQAIRVAVYGRAILLRTKIGRPPSAESIASDFVDFVKGERWRLDALDVALKYADRRSSVETLIARASEIVAWADPSVAVRSEEETANEPISVLHTGPAEEETPVPDTGPETQKVKPKKK